MLQILFTILQIALVTHGIVETQAQLTEPEMIEVLATYDSEASIWCNKNVHAIWNVQTDVLNSSLVADQVRNTESLDV